MATYDDSDGIDGQEVASLTTPALTVSSSANRACYGAAITTFGNSAAATGMRIGGSGGTVMTNLSGDLTFTKTNARCSVWGVAAPGTGSQTGYTTFPSSPAPQFSLMESVTYTGVDQGNIEDGIGNNIGFFDGTGSGTASSNTVSGLTTGDTVGGFLFIQNFDSAAISLAPSDGSCVQRGAFFEHPTNTIKLAYFEGTSSGSTKQLQVAITADTGSTLEYRFVAFKIPNSSSGYTLSADSGSYALNGQTTNLLYARIMSGEQGSYALSGQANTLTYGSGSRTMAAETGLYTLVGSNALVDLAMRAEAGSYTLTGQIATLTFSPLTNRTLTAEQGNYTLNGQAANLLFQKVMPAVTGVYNLTGYQTALQYSGAPTSSGYLVKRMNISAIKIGL